MWWLHSLHWWNAGLFLTLPLQQNVYWQNDSLFLTSSSICQDFKKEEGSFERSAASQQSGNYVFSTCYSGRGHTHTHTHTHTHRNTQAHRYTHCTSNVQICTASFFFHALETVQKDSTSLSRQHHQDQPHCPRTCHWMTACRQGDCHPSPKQSS